MLLLLLQIGIQCHTILEADPGNDLTYPSSHTQFINKEIHIDFYWDFDQQYVTMMLVFDKLSYFGFGFGSSMEKADIWIFQIQEGVITVQDHYSVKKTRPPLDTADGGTEDVELIGFKYNDNGKTIIKFKRKIDTGDPLDEILVQSEQATVIYAYGPTEEDQQLKYHKEHRGWFTFPFIQGDDSEATSDFDWYTIHKWTNIVCWGFLVDVGIIIARYHKTSPYRLGMHGLLMALIVVTSLGANYLMLNERWEIFDFSTFNERSLVTQIHFIVGILTSILLLGQCIGGFLVKQMLNSNKVNEKISKKPTLHAIAGHTLYVFEKIQIGLGLYQMPEEQLILPYYITYFLIFCWRILLEFLYQKQFFVNILVGKPIQKSIYPNSEIDNLLNYVELKDDSLIDKGKLWCLFNNDVIDLSKSNHPGGQYIWKFIQGREISRFIYGAYSLESLTLRPYKHSQYALAMLAKLKIGQLQAIPFYYSQQTNSLIDQSDKKNLWSLSNVEPLSDKIAKFHFKNEELSFRTSLNGIEAFGRYFLISSENKQISTRPYTMVLCMTKPNIELRKLFIKLADSIINKQQPSEVPVPTEACSELPFIIKRYESKNGFSDYIHQDNTNGKYLIQGPFGVSFGLPESGHFVIICGGTGLLPFLDLLDYFLKYSVYNALRNTSGEEVAQFANLQKLQFKKYRITMFLAVNSEDELIGKDIYFSILNLQKHLEETNFKLILRSHFKLKNIQTTTLRFDEEMLSKEIESITAVRKFLICGPPKMNNETPIILESLGVLPRNIHLV